MLDFIADMETGFSEKDFAGREGTNFFIKIYTRIECFKYYGRNQEAFTVFFARLLVLI